MVHSDRTVVDLLFKHFSSWLWFYQHCCKSCVHYLRPSLTLGRMSTIHSPFSSVAYYI